MADRPIASRATDARPLFIVGLFVLGLIQVCINWAFWMYPPAVDIFHSLARPLMSARLDALVYASGVEAGMLAYIAYRKREYARHVAGEDGLAVHSVDVLGFTLLTLGPIVLSLLNIFWFPHGVWWVPSNLTSVVIGGTLITLSACLLVSFGLALLAHGKYLSARRTKRERDHEMNTRLYR